MTMKEKIVPLLCFFSLFALGFTPLLIPESIIRRYITYLNAFSAGTLLSFVFYEIIPHIFLNSFLPPNKAFDKNVYSQRLQKKFFQNLNSLLSLLGFLTSLILDYIFHGSHSGCCTGGGHNHDHKHEKHSHQNKADKNEKKTQSPFEIEKKFDVMIEKPNEQVKNNDQTNSKEILIIQKQKISVKSSSVHSDKAKESKSVNSSVILKKGSSGRVKKSRSFWKIENFAFVIFKLFHSLSDGLPLVSLAADKDAHLVMVGTTFFLFLHEIPLNLSGYTLFFKNTNSVLFSILWCCLSNSGYIFLLLIFLILENMKAEKLIDGLVCFSGGMLVKMVFCEMAPKVKEDMESSKKGKKRVLGILLVLGMFMVAALMTLVADNGHDHGHGHGHGHDHGNGHNNDHSIKNIDGHSHVQILGHDHVKGHGKMERSSQIDTDTKYVDSDNCSRHRQDYSKRKYMGILNK